MRSQHTSTSAYKHLPSQVKNFAEFIVQCVERVEDNPENWPTLNELPQADTSDLEQAYQYQSTIDSDFES